MHIAEKLDWNNEVIIYANSGDTSGDKTRVVGYSSIAFFKEEGLTKEEQDVLLKLARDTMELYVREGKILKPDMDIINKYPNLLKTQGAFVSLDKLGRLRGSIGHLIPVQQLYLDVRDNAINAVANDHRFEPVQPDELSSITATISVLTIPKKLSYSSWQDLLNKLTPLKDGVILRSGNKQSTYLPQVWEQIPAKEDFLSYLCRKGNLNTDCWKDPSTEIFVYNAIVFEEH